MGRPTYHPEWAQRDAPVVEAVTRQFPEPSASFIALCRFQRCPVFRSRSKMTEACVLLAAAQSAAVDKATAAGSRLPAIDIGHRLRRE